MQFFSGFSISKEEYLLEDFLNTSAYTISGFSYGAIKAFQEAKKKLASRQRVDTLQLLSPAFFQSKDEKFKRLQKRAYSKNKIIYLKQFLNSCFEPYEKKIVQNRVSNLEELDELLFYIWSLDELKKLQEQGVKIEVYLGGKDSIVDALSAKEFFLEVATVTYIKDANHFLQTT
ncbi:pimelyl-ACP methyl ester esterase BioV [Sulfurimonas sp.]|uniref:pimelyl-ACP methyl ester esterase BioV n=1 Tax=Sulfurimonas sp. TaxID=2022749 RepID=UPI002B479E76|nr:pimelyl-ACP methyl ester esterase BioV [Sulfurimonas sp.]